jgi:hypothetical protein
MSVRIVNVTSAVPGLPGTIGVPIVGRVPPAPLEPPLAADPPEPPLAADPPEPAAAPPLPVVAPPLPVVAPPLPVVAPPLPPDPELEEPDEPHPAAAAIERTDQSGNEQRTGASASKGQKGRTDIVPVSGQPRYAKSTAVTPNSPRIAA